MFNSRNHIERIGHFNTIHPHESRVHAYDEKNNTSVKKPLAYHPFILLIIGAIAFGLLSQSGSLFQIFTVMASIVGWYVIGMIILVVMMLIHKTDNGIARFLMKICHPVFQWVGNHVVSYFSLKYRLVLGPIVSIVLLMMLQKLLEEM